VVTVTTRDGAVLEQQLGGWLDVRAGGFNRRAACRVTMPMHVHVESPVQMFCELRDISVIGAAFDRELPCTPGIGIDFIFEVPTYGASLKPESIKMHAEVVRVEDGVTGVRFSDLRGEEAKQIVRLVYDQQRRILLGRHLANERKLRDRQAASSR
jgi:hypothetical protein